ncbi:MAG: Ig-like domain-containing protein [Bacteroidales bacterium]|jgi:uncharacterized protein YjdB|nr:Ig-like domain-containing protein [Bacteroidales bacterium]
MKTIKIILTIGILAGGILFTHSCDKDKEKEYNVSSVSLDSEELNIGEGDTVYLVCTVKPKQAKNQEVKWKSSDPDVASVDEQGVIVGVSLGEALITVTSVEGNKKAACKVIVSNDINGVTLDQHNITLVVGGVMPLIATVTPKQAENKEVSWKSSDNSIATVDSIGKVRGIALGKAEIVVTTKQGNYTDTCLVTVDTTGWVSVTDISLDKTTLSLSLGKTEQLKTTITPADASNKEVTWKSNNTAVADVDATGNVTAKTTGEATITATAEDGKKTATCKVTVKGIAVVAVNLDKTSLTFVDIGDTEQLTATIAPSNASNKAVTWKSSNTAIATVDQSGKVKAVAPGWATITVTTDDGGKTATCAVTIIAHVSSVTLDKEYLLLKTGNSSTLVATVLPANAADKSLTWTSSNTSVATVNQSGKVTAVSGGNTIITVTTNDNNKTATCSVTVDNRDIYIAGYTHTNGLAATWENGTLTNHPAGTHATDIFASGNNVYVAGYEYYSPNPAIAKTWKNGTLTNLSDGTQNAYAIGLFVSGNDVYAAGYENNASDVPVAKIWKNGTATNLTNGIRKAYASDVFVSGNDVYVAGYEYYNSSNHIAIVWKNGTAMTLAAGAGSSASSIFVSGNDVYVGGKDPAQGGPTVWKNGVVHTSFSTNISSDYVRAIHVSGNNVYAVTKYEVYKNGSLLYASLDELQGLYVINSDVYYTDNWNLYKNGVIIYRLPLFPSTRALFVK